VWDGWQVRDIAAAIGDDTERQTLMYSATWSPVLEELASSLLSQPVRLSLGQQHAAGESSAACSTIEQKVEVVPEDEKWDKLLRLLREDGFAGGSGRNPSPESRVIVFSNTKKGCDALCKWLSSQGVPDTDCIHGNRPQAEREEALRSFTHGRCRCLVATDVAARGIDVKDVTLVVNFDFPDTMGPVGVEDYVHRIGRTGRAGKKGRSHTFFPTKPDDRHHANSHHLVRHLEQAGVPVSPALRKLDRGNTVSVRAARKGQIDKGQEYEKRKQAQGPREPVPVYADLEAAKAGARVEALSRQITKHGQQRQLTEALAVYEELLAEGLTPSRYTHSGLINAYISSGDVQGARRSFAAMTGSGIRPNVVIYTTLLKGYCAVGDTAAALALFEAMAKEEPLPVKPDLRSVNTFIRGCIRVGEIQEADKAFQAMEPRWGLEPDATSYKYMIKLLAQGLRFNEVKELLKDLRAKAKAGHPGAEAALAGLGNGVGLHLDASHAAALLGKWPASEANVKRARDALAAPLEVPEAAEAAGGKRKRGEAGTGASGEGQGGLFGETRQRELKLEVDRVAAFLEASPAGESRDAPDLEDFMSRSYVFSSLLSSEEAQVTASPVGVDGVVAGLVAKLERTMGLDECVRRGTIEAGGLEKRIRRTLSDKGKFKWNKVFEKELPVKLEICSGNGDWVAAQAGAEAGASNWVACELRHDRVYSIFSRMIFGGHRNLAVMGGDASCVITERIKKGSVAQVCVNFPEPPHWSGNEAAESKLHLLTPSFFKAIHKCLAEKGKLTIFSDNYLYCQSLAATLGTLQDREGNKIFQSNDRALCTGDGGYETHSGVRLYYGIPGKDNGHAVNVTSYFDRFWERGQHTERYFIAVSRLQ